MIVVVGFTITITCKAQTTFTAQGIMNFVNIGVGARAAGMGYCFINNSSDPSVIFWNPGGLARLDGTRAFLDVNYWIADIKEYSFVFSQEIGNNSVIGLSFITMDYGQINGTTINVAAASIGAFDYLDTGPVDVGNYALGIAYSRAISDQFSIGGQVKYVYSNLGSSEVTIGSTTGEVDNHIHALGIDFGAQFNTRYNDLTFGMAVRNLSGEIKYPDQVQGYYLPLVLTLGFSVDAAKFVAPDNTQNSLVLSAELLHPTDFVEKVSLGAEYSLNQQFFIRAGYALNYSLERLSLGAGIRVPTGSGSSIEFDYAYTTMVYFNGVSRLSLSAQL